MAPLLFSDVAMSIHIPDRAGAIKAAEKEVVRFPHSKPAIVYCPSRSHEAGITLCEAFDHAELAHRKWHGSKKEAARMEEMDITSSGDYATESILFHEIPGWESLKLLVEMDTIFLNELQQILIAQYRHHPETVKAGGIFMVSEDRDEVFLTFGTFDRHYL
ncbi:uncharacterized protein CDV56_100753 [Aspergillus thermomutatus]|uniref:Uncharacterized protein n=1 Tax=Aspergillus thermomutatus TaxID=41047 RepID=A0A397GNI7_ASPTH|nr:uncharacterized protein CDV56_100753 [Aspergillus thermomutatus]RHZ52612.1 hypothetical protein CDV56_100753 [Aspergillus thermomutatus]